MKVSANGPRPIRAIKALRGPVDRGLGLVSGKEFLEAKSKATLGSGGVPSKYNQGSLGTVIMSFKAMCLFYHNNLHQVYYRKGSVK